jgi:hypothetical protein
MVMAESLGDEYRQTPRLAERAVVALARRLSVIMHRMWSDGSEFRWTKDPTAT